MPRKIPPPPLLLRADYYDLGGAARQGAMLPTASAEALERWLAVDEEDLFTRARLLGYYTVRKRDADKEKHVLWFIRNVPDCVFAGDKYLAISRKSAPAAYSRVAGAWQKAAKSPQAIVNNAMWLWNDERIKAVKLLTALHSQSPANPWCIALLKKAGRKVVSAAIPLTPANEPLELNERSLFTLVHHGRYLPSDSVDVLRTALKAFPHDVSMRFELLGFAAYRLPRNNVLGVDAGCQAEMNFHSKWVRRFAPTTASNLPRSWKHEKVKAVGPQMDRISLRAKVAKPEAPAAFSFEDWVDEIAVGRAELAGSYQWIPRASVQRIEKFLTSPWDVYNRARLLGSVSRMDPNSNLGQQHRERMRWFWHNAPTARMLALFTWWLPKHPMLAEVRAKADAELRRKRHDPGTLFALAVMLSKSDRPLARKLAKVLEPTKPLSALRIKAMCGGRLPDFSVEKTWRDFGFEAGRRDEKIEKIAKAIDVFRSTIEGWGLPARSAAANEYALLVNPNDVVLRAELVGFYERQNRLYIYLGGPFPDVIEPVLRHVLWFMRHCPTVNFGSSWELHEHHDPGTVSLGAHAPIMRAAIAQMEAYPEDKEVYLAMTNAFPLYFDAERLVYLRRAARQWRNDSRIRRAIQHAKDMMSRD